MKIKVLAFGKLKNPGFRESADYYIRNTQSFVTLEEVELRPERVNDKSAGERKRLQAIETEAILAKAPNSRAMIVLDEKGKSLPTQDWAKHISQLMGEGHSEIVFVIGSSIGVSEELRSKARLCLSLGSQTLAHELARVVLYEQIYRVFSVIRGHPYHNEG